MRLHTLCMKAPTWSWGESVDALLRTFSESNLGSNGLNDFLIRRLGRPVRLRPAEAFARRGGRVYLRPSGCVRSRRYTTGTAARERLSCAATHHEGNMRA